MTKNCSQKIGSKKHKDDVQCAQSYKSQTFKILKHESDAEV